LEGHNDSERGGGGSLGKRGYKKLRGSQGENILRRDGHPKQKIHKEPEKKKKRWLERTKSLKRAESGSTGGRAPSKKAGDSGKVGEGSEVQKKERDWTKTAGTKRAQKVVGDRASRRQEESEKNKEKVVKCGNNVSTWTIISNILGGRSPEKKKQENARPEERDVQHYNMGVEKEQPPQHSCGKQIQAKGGH